MDLGAAVLDRESGSAMGELDYRGSLIMRSTRLMLFVMAMAPMTATAQAKPSTTGSGAAAAKPAMQHDHSAMEHGQGAAPEKEHDGMKSGWAELDAFHALLMSMWHPAQKDTFTVARALAPALAANAAAWGKSKGPAKCDNTATRKALPGIVAGSQSYAELVAGKGADAPVKAALKKVHDEFERVAMPCIMAGMKEMSAGKDAAGMRGMKHEPATKQP